MKRFLYSILTLFFIYLISSAIYTNFAARKVPKNNLDSFLNSADKSSKKFVLFLGDSITHGTVSFDYVRALSENPSLQKFTFVNEGVNSRLTYQILEKVPNSVSLSPEHIFILIGTNDAKAALNEEEYKGYNKLWNLPEIPNITTYEKNLRKIVHSLKAETHSKIHLISIPVLGEALESSPLKQSIAYSEIIHKIAKESGVSYLPFNEALVAELQKEPNHPEKEYAKNTPRLFWAIYRHFGLFQTWDQISEQSGRIFLTDDIHINERAGNILLEMIQKELTEPSENQYKNSFFFKYFFQYLSLSLILKQTY
ncbi:SGNH/GDSL hydrolase family protein [Leptospira venezuelensis]|uniref:SGNH/GDSL hydrolase family protein n=1 Tax=Leptospira venezuelensis TaxID=1958811 RepID=UPI000A37CB97|nr:SGNH/GDSL hydrolase family protein [Leptospira venezuelensis]